MRLDAVTAELRPRSDWEAVDLGLALVRRDFWRCLVMWWLALGLPALLAGWWWWDSPGYFLLMFWWCKPAGSRMVLLQLSRRLFGEQPPWRVIWRELPRVWWRRFFFRFIVARWSPGLPVALAVEDLEGLRGKDYARRVRQVARRGNGAVVWTYLTAEFSAGWFGLALFGVISMLVPEGQDALWTQALEEWGASGPFDVPLLLMRSIAACMIVAMSLADVFLTGAGFGLYVNTRTWIEGWDVELAFRRLSERLAKVLGVLALTAWCWLPAASEAVEPNGALDRAGIVHLGGERGILPVREESASRWSALETTGRMPVIHDRQDANLPAKMTDLDGPTPHSIIEQVKAQKEFVVHKVRLRLPKSEGLHRSRTGGWFGQLLGNMIEWFAYGLAVAFIVWLCWKYRYLLALGGWRDNVRPQPIAARVVMGMDVTPQSLPADIPGAVWHLWQAGQRKEALSLLYRGAISRLIEHGQVEIQQADTEGDCLRRVQQVGTPAHPGYFSGLTRVWIAQAYAGQIPADAVVESLCREWPFVERRGA